MTTGSGQQGDPCTPLVGANPSGKEGPSGKDVWRVFTQRNVRLGTDGIYEQEPDRSRAITLGSADTDGRAPIPSLEASSEAKETIFNFKYQAAEKSQQPLSEATRPPSGDLPSSRFCR